MVYAGPNFGEGVTFNDAEQNNVIKKTALQGANATGHVLHWDRTKYPLYLDRSLLVNWCMVNMKTVVIPRDIPVPVLNLWCRVPTPKPNENEQQRKEVEMSVTVVHIYFNFWLQCFQTQNRDGKIYTLGPTIPLVDVQLWDKYAQTVTPIYSNVHPYTWLWTQNGTLSTVQVNDAKNIYLVEIFWPLSTLLSLLVLHATGVMHLDLSFANLFYIDIQQCLITYRDRELRLPFVPLITDFDLHAFGWTSFRERAIYETCALRKLVLQSYVRFEQYKEIYDRLTPNLYIKNNLLCKLTRTKAMFMQLFDLIDNTPEIKCDTCIRYLFGWLEPYFEDARKTNVVVEHKYTESVTFEQFQNARQYQLSQSLQKNCAQYRIAKAYLNPGTQLKTFLNRSTKLGTFAEKAALHERETQIIVVPVKFANVGNLFDALTH